MINERIRLSVGPSPALRAFGIVFGLLFTTVSAVFVALPWLMAAGFDMTGDLVTDGGFSCAGEGCEELPIGVTDPGTGGFSDATDQWWDRLQDGVHLVALLFSLVGAIFVLIGVYLTLRMLRTAAWLDGSTVTVRGAARTRSVDLATADVTAGAAAYRVGGELREQLLRLPTIEAQDPNSRRRVTIPLHGMGLATLPPHELRALADAMTAGRPVDDGRNGDVHALAGQLRQMAGNPLGLAGGGAPS